MNIAEVVCEKTLITNVEDALDLMANAGYQGANGIIIQAENICPEFFDLSTRIAGNILQKFSNYRMKLAIIGDFNKYSSKSLHDFIFESNKAGHVIFVSSSEEAIRRLTV